MKSLRVWLLVLLAFALPVRGAMAAAMVCAPAAVHEHAVGFTGHAHGQAHHADSAAHAHAGQGHDATAGHDTADKCSACASCCAATPPLVAGFALAQAPPAATQFPEHRAPAAEFLSAGQERPPRSI